jgi:hypothetical protein
MYNAAITLPCSGDYTLHIKGASLVVATRKEEEAIPISSIQSFALKEPSRRGYGKITFSSAKPATFGINVGMGIGLALGAERTYYFSPEWVERAKELRDHVLGYSEAQKSAAPQSGTLVSVVEEIRGLKGLLDDGILTQEEFDAKKKQLLGL